MTQYCIDLDLKMPLFKSTLDPVEFLKQDDQHLAKHYKISKDLLSDDIIKFFNKFELTIRIVEIFYRPAGANSRIHIDTEKPGDFVKLNWVYGGKGSVMSWYAPNENYTGVMDSTPVESYATYYKQHQVILLHSQKVGQPSLVQVGIPHSIDNNLTERFCVSVVFEYNDTKERPMFSQAYEIFKDYINEENNSCSIN